MPVPGCAAALFSGGVSSGGVEGVERVGGGSGSLSGRAGGDEGGLLPPVVVGGVGSLPGRRPHRCWRLRISSFL